MSGAGADRGASYDEQLDRLRRRVLWSIPNGLFIVGTRSGATRNLMTISLVTQVSMEPKLVGIAVESSSFTHKLLSSSGAFALSLIPRSSRSVVRHFVKPVNESDVEIDRATGTGTIRGEEVFTAASGAPVISLNAGWIDCEVRHRLDLGSHNLFVGEVLDCGEPARPADVDAPAIEVLRMEDTRMNYGG